MELCNGLVQRRVSRGNTRTTHNQNRDCCKGFCHNRLRSLLRGVGRYTYSEELFECLGILSADAVNVLHSHDEQSAICRCR